MVLHKLIIYSSSDRVPIFYVLLDFWMISLFYIMGPIGQNQSQQCLKEVNQVAVLVECQKTTVLGMWHGGKVRYL